MHITATEFKKNMGKYMELAHGGEEIVVTKNGREYISLNTKNKSMAEVWKKMVGIIDEKDFPPVGEDPKFDGILKRGGGK